MTPIKVNSIKEEVIIQTKVNAASLLKVKIFKQANQEDINSWLDDMAGKIEIVDIQQSSHLHTDGRYQHSVVVISIFYLASRKTPMPLG